MTDRWLVALVGVGFVLRAGFALFFDGRMELLNDDHVYANGAAGLLANGELDTGWFVRPPLYFLFVAFGQALSIPLPLGWWLMTALLQAAVGAATVVPVYAIARRLAGVAEARAAGVAIAINPTLVAFTHLLWPETLFTALVACVVALLPDLRPERAGRVVLAGALTGLAMLVKSSFGLLTPLLALSWCHQLGWRKGLEVSARFGLVAALVIAPWVVRNLKLHGPSVIIENPGAYTLWEGNDLRPAGEILAEWRALPDPATRSQVALREGMARIGDDPARFARMVPHKAAQLWGPEFFVTRQAILGGYGEVSRAGLLTSFWLLQLGWLLVLATAAAGLRAGWRAPWFRPVILYAGVLTLVVSLLVSTTRFRVPLLAPLCALSGVGAVLLARGRARAPEWIAVALAVGFLAVVAQRPVFRVLVRGEFGHPAELRHEDWMKFRY